MIEIKITDESAAGVLVQLAELSARLVFPLVPVGASDPVMPELKPVISQEVTEEAKPKRTRRTAEQIAADNAKEAEAAAGEPESAGRAEPEPAGKSGETVTSSTTAAERVTDAVLDFDRDVAPVVLGYVRSKGKPWVMAILNQFGVERASELAPEQYGELVDALNDAT